MPGLLGMTSACVPQHGEKWDRHQDRLDVTPNEKHQVHIEQFLTHSQDNVMTHTAICHAAQPCPSLVFFASKSKSVKWDKSKYHDYNRFSGI